MYELTDCYVSLKGVSFFTILLFLDEIFWHVLLVVYVGVFWFLNLLQGFLCLSVMILYVRGHKFGIYFV